MDEKVIKRKTVLGFFWKFAERIIAQFVSFVVSVILARLLTPDDYSTVSLVMVFFAFANVLISGGFNSALVQKKDSDNLDYSTILIFSVAISIAVYLLLFFAAPLIAALYHRDDLIKIVRIMGLSLPVTAVKSIWCSYISSRLLFKKFFMATIWGTVVSAIVGIFLAHKGYGAWALVAQNMLNTLIDTIILVISSHVNFGFRFSFERFRGLFKYGWKVLVSSIIGTLYSQTVPLFIGAKYTNEDLSFYTKGKSFPDLLSSTATYTLSAVLFPFLSKFQDEKSKLLEYTRLYIRLSSFIAFPLMLGLYAISNNFVLIILTSKWAPAVHYIKVFCIAMMFEMVHMGNCETIKAMGRSDIFLKMEIIKKSCYFITIALFLVCTNRPESLAYAFVVCTAIALVVNSIPNIKLIDYSIKLQMADLLPNLFISVIMTILVMLIGWIMPDGKVITLITQIIGGALIYLFLSMITKNDNLKTIYQMIRMIFVRE